MSKIQATENKAQSTDKREITGTDNTAGTKRNLDVIVNNEAGNPIPVTGTITVDVSNDEIGATRLTSTLVVVNTAEIIGKANVKLADRNFIMIQPQGGDIYIGDSLVTVSTGLILKDGETMELKVDAAQEMYAISAGSVTCRLFEATLV